MGIFLSLCFPVESKRCQKYIKYVYSLFLKLYYAEEIPALSLFVYCIQSLH